MSDQDASTKIQDLESQISMLERKVAAWKQSAFHYGELSGLPVDTIKTMVNHKKETAIQAGDPYASMLNRLENLQGLTEAQAQWIHEASEENGVNVPIWVQLWPRSRNSDMPEYPLLSLYTEPPQARSDLPTFKVWIRLPIVKPRETGIAFEAETVPSE